MQDVFKVLRAIEATRSRNEKKETMRNAQCDIELLQKFLVYSMTPRTIYGIGERSIRKHTPPGL